MSNNLLSQFEGKIDFVGQQQVDTIVRYVLVITTILSFVVGFSLQSLSATFGIFGGSTLLLALAVIPPWPMYNRHPVQWLPVIGDKPKES
ncbi:microsomal signal peptidase 12 kDa subunit [Pluteus cervinus]|uniref:Microsomal signal peptidase 12 kDa subunit n=1 Tax=Pluteus cervinus TaxID=181527 RepID=A0ACD3AZD8_9AGAR|nr:microsomal signal peptidase 12 kDa subunit [Pluteus cervinus]